MVIDAPHEDGSAQDAAGLPESAEFGPMAESQAPTGGRVSTLQWVRHEDVAARISQGWKVGQSDLCHHNDYAVLMVVA